MSSHNKNKAVRAYFSRIDVYWMQTIKSKGKQSDKQNIYINFHFRSRLQVTPKFFEYKVDLFNLILRSSFDG